MKKFFKKITGIGVAIVTYFILAFPASAQVAVNPCPNGAGGGTNFNVLCSLTANNIGNVVSSVVTILLIAAALIALFFLIVGGIRWITSGGDKSKVESARNTIIASIIGLVIALLAFFIITVVLGIFGLSLTNLQLPKIVSNPVVSQPDQDAPQSSVFAENLEIPWGIAFLPDQSMLVTERPGRVRSIDAQGNLRSEPVATISDVYQNGEGGLLGIALHPQFSQNHFVYLYYSYRDNSGSMRNKVVRYVFDGASLINQKTIIDNIPGNSNHDGGRIKFGPDGFLYITTGDSENPSLAQDKNALAGKILRLTDEGQAAPDNPFGSAQGESRFVYSYGHRNPQGLAWDDTGKLWATEHGRSAPTGYDELNLIDKGQNYGWPTIQGDEQKAGMITPVINSGPTTTWAPAGAAFYLPAGGQVNGSIFFGGLRGQGLYEAVLNGNGVAELKKHFDGQFGRIRDVVLGPDNMLYITTSNRDGRGTAQANDDKIYRVNPAKL